MSDIAVTALALKQAQTLHSAQIAMTRKQHEMEMDLVSMLADAVRNAPAPQGMGLQIDKRA
ncbi:putative motility protein [Pelagibacterium lacus]|uniref:Putative motility protein n=1 Tax=Pelagibacterium lacus TaxID=2282655 RepID=A0A369W6B7_9HYPH|nr:putative motility protein [Pelagibacterium lacus]RDE08802.1 putative motility protein [Pelagibacterium lacus]